MNGGETLLDAAREALAAARARVEQAPVPVRRAGRVRRAVGLAIESRGPQVGVGEECRLETADGDLLGMAEVVGFESGTVYSMPVDPVRGVRFGDRVVATGRQPTVPVGERLLGRVLDALGRPLDGRPLGPGPRRAIHGEPVRAMHRARITEPMATGVRAIDGLVTIGRGQRVGIFAGAGVGKSRLLGALARHAADEIIVIALVGERGREVRDFVEGELGEAGLRRAVVFVATSDEPPVRRVRCALAATTVAEEFRRQGRNVTLLMDSLTRVAMALREIGLATGEPPVTKGYPPSVFGFLPRLLERAGREQGAGAMTGIYTVFVEGDDLDEPISDASRAILDGHLVLSRALFERAHFPAIDVLASNSRVMPEVSDAGHLEAAALLRRMLAIHRESADLIAIGAYREGSDPELDRAIAVVPKIEAFLRQDLSRPSPLDETRRQLVELAAGCAR
ncbi:MAG: FliI/YscN family ATPase [Acidobacteria bacterium]|nr:MAG: FliI/YscN family ATPase [Acidobacteriota bacterium]